MRLKDLPIQTVTTGVKPQKFYTLCSLITHRAGKLNLGARCKEDIIAKCTSDACYVVKCKRRRDFHYLCWFHEALFRRNVICFNFPVL